MKLTRTTITKSRSGHYTATVRSTVMPAVVFSAGKLNSADRARSMVPSLEEQVLARVAELSWGGQAAPAPVAPKTITHIVRTNAELKALHLSFYSLVKLAEVLNCVDPQTALEHRLTHPFFADKGWKGELTLDDLGNFVSFA